MVNSMALLEFSSMAEGMKYTNDVLKDVDLKLEKNEIMCPGKYVVLLSGKAQQIRTAVQYADSYKNLIAKEEILKLHEGIIPTFNAMIEFVPGQNYGIIETKRFVNAVKMADSIAKGSNVTIEKIFNRLGLIGKGMVIFSGTSADLSMAKRLIESEFDSKDLVAIELLHTVKEDIFKI